MTSDHAMNFMLSGSRFTERPTPASSGRMARILPRIELERFDGNDDGYEEGAVAKARAKARSSAVFDDDSDSHQSKSSDNRVYLAKEFRRDLLDLVMELLPTLCFSLALVGLITLAAALAYWRLTILVPAVLAIIGFTTLGVVIIYIKRKNLTDVPC